MKNTLTLAALSFLAVGCGMVKEMPPPPDIKYHYMVDVVSVGASDALGAKLLRAVSNLDEYKETRVRTLATGKSWACVRFDVISFNPYKIKFDAVVDDLECNGLGGYRAPEFIKMMNWTEDVIKWGQDLKDKQKKSFKYK